MNIERLEKIATHLETGELGHKVFDFGAYNTGVRASNGCGTNGCAIGEFPFIFKNDWEYRENENVPILKTSKYSPTLVYKSIKSYLDITSIQIEFLFYPAGCLIYITTIHLPLYSTRYEVATRIRRFIDYQLHHTLDAREAQAKKDRDFKIAQRAVRIRMIKAHEVIRWEYEKVC